MEIISKTEESESWKQYASEAELRMVAKIESNPNPSKKDIELVNFVKSTSVAPDKFAKASNDAVKATHLFELSSITVSWPSTLENLDDVVELYGRIHLVDEYDDEFAVFCHERKDAQVFSVGDDNLLTISLRDCKLNRPHLLPKHFRVKMYLKDRYRDITIVKGKFKLDFTGKVIFNKEQCIDFHTQEYGVVSVHYAILQYGVVAMVDCKIGKNEGSSLRGNNGQYPRVKGSVSAVVDRKLGENDGFSRVLFDKECFIPTIFDPLVEQSWTSPWFAVPAYSSLKIGVDLDIDGEKFETDKSNFVEFQAWDNGGAPFKQIIRGENWHIVVSVTWNHAFWFLSVRDIPGFDLGVLGKESLYYLETEGEDEDKNEGDKCREPTTDIPGFDSEGVLGKESLYYSEIEDEDGDKNEDDKCRESADFMQESHIKRFVYPDTMVKIFSIIVHHFVVNNDESDEHVLKKKRNDGTESHLLISGVIQLDDSMGSYEIFNKDKTAPALLECNGALSLVHPSHCHWGLEFGMHLELHDGQGHEISRGFIGWNSGIARPWYGKRVCSVVPGDFGFAAVHYTMFPDAVQANVNVSFKWLGQPLPCQVYGRIYARYGCYRYITRYEKENYQSMLFDRCKLKDGVKLQNDGNLPLSKVFVAVPYDDSLIVIADLRVYVSGFGEHILRGKATFKTGCDLGEQEINETRCCLASLGICVDWGRQANAL